MIISVAQLKRHPDRTLSLKLSQPQPPFELGGQEFGFIGPVEVKGEIGLKDATVLVSGQIRAELELSCGRCLGKYLLGLEAPFEERFVPGTAISGEEDQDEYRVYVGDEIDLGPLVMESIILALPMQHLCSADCRGMCPACGVNLNSQDCHCLREEPDARLSVLAKLLPREN
ncbi:MAG: YceD family protein [Bacillota bacterium]